MIYRQPEKGLRVLWLCCAGNELPTLRLLTNVSFFIFLCDYFTLIRLPSQPRLWAATLLLSTLTPITDTL